MHVLHLVAFVGGKTPVLAPVSTCSLLSGVSNPTETFPQGLYCKEAARFEAILAF